MTDHVGTKECKNVLHCSRVGPASSYLLQQNISPSLSLSNNLKKKKKNHIGMQPNSIRTRPIMPLVKSHPTGATLAHWVAHLWWVHWTLPTKWTWKGDPEIEDKSMVSLKYELEILFLKSWPFTWNSNPTRFKFDPLHWFPKPTLSYKLTNPETPPLLYTCVHVCVYIYPFRTTSFSILSLIVPLLGLEYHGRGYVQRCS